MAKQKQENLTLFQRRRGVLVPPLKLNINNKKSIPDKVRINTLTFFFWSQIATHNKKNVSKCLAKLAWSKLQVGAFLKEEGLLEKGQVLFPFEAGELKVLKIKTGTCFTCFVSNLNSPSLE